MFFFEETVGKMDARLPRTMNFTRLLVQLSGSVHISNTVTITRVLKIEQGYYYNSKYYLNPHFIVQSTSDDTAFEKDLDPFLFLFWDLESEVFVPVLKLVSFQSFHVEIRTFYLKKWNLQNYSKK